MIEVCGTPTEKGGVWSEKALQIEEAQEESYCMLSIFLDTVETLR